MSTSSTHIDTQHQTFSVGKEVFCKVSSPEIGCKELKRLIFRVSALGFDGFRNTRHMPKGLRPPKSRRVCHSLVETAKG